MGCETFQRFQESRAVPFLQHSGICCSGFKVHRRDVNMQVALGYPFVHANGGNALKLDLAGFQYLDSRDLIGFIDGTANPKEDKAREAALIPEGQTGAGGSFVLSQQWVHNLPAFNSLSQSEQERVVGRTKPDSVELEGDAMPPTSHVSRTDYKENGKALKIVQAERSLWDGRRARPVFPGLLLRAVSVSGFAGTYVRCIGRRGFRPPHPLFPTGCQFVLVCAVA